MPRVQGIAPFVPERLHLQVVILGVVEIHVGHVDGHRTVDVHRQDGNTTFVLEHPDTPHDFLGTPHGKRRHNDGAATIGGLPNDPCEIGCWIRWMLAVPVGGLHDQDVGFGRLHRIAQDRSVPTANVAGKNQPHVGRSV